MLNRQMLWIVFELFLVMGLTWLGKYFLSACLFVYFSVSLHSFLSVFLFLCFLVRCLFVSMSCFIASKSLISLKVKNKGCLETLHTFFFDFFNTLDTGQRRIQIRIYIKYKRWNVRNPTATIYTYLGLIFFLQLRWFR